MTSSHGIRAGRAFVELSADDSKLVRGLKLAQAKLKAFGAGVRSMGLKMMAIGGAITGPLIAAAKQTAASGAALWDMSKRTAMSVESLSALGFAAEMTGTDLDGLERGVRRMQKSIVRRGRPASLTSTSMEMFLHSTLSTALWTQTGKSSATASSPPARALAARAGEPLTAASGRGILVSCAKRRRRVHVGEWTGTEGDASLS